MSKVVAEGEDRSCSMAPSYDDVNRKTRGEGLVSVWSAAVSVWRVWRLLKWQWMKQIEPCSKYCTNVHYSGVGMGISRKRRKREEVSSQRTGGPPKHAVAADMSQQVPSTAAYGRRRYYRDEPFTCGDCGREEVWTASQQKWYFEVAKGSIYGRAKFCRACRQKRNIAKGEQRRRSQP